MRTGFHYAVFALLFILAVCLTGFFVDPNFLTALFDTQAWRQMQREHR